MWCLLLTFPELFRLGWLISSVFLTRTSCRKTTHANSYYGAWPGWMVSINVLPITTPPKRLHTQDTSWELGRRSLSSVTSSCCDMSEPGEATQNS